MRWNHIVAVLLAVFCSGLGLHPAAVAAPCALPNQLTNGQVADASQVMADFNALVACLSAAPAGSLNALQYNAGDGFGGVGPLTDGQLLIGATGSAPQAATLTAGTGIAITSTPGGVTITATGGGGASYDPVILAESSLLHYWPMSDAAGSTTLADVKGTTPLPITDTLSNVVLGTPGLIHDGTSGATLLGLSTKTNGIIIIPAGSIPATGDYTIEFIFRTQGYLGTQSIPAAFIMDLDRVGSMELYIDYGRLGVSNELRGGAGTWDNWRSAISLAPMSTYHIATVASSATNTITRYLNGLPLPIRYSGTIPRQTQAGQFGSLARTNDGNAYSFMGMIEKVAIYGSALPASTIAAHYAASGLR